MSGISARGIIIRQNDYGEGHRMLSIFTEDLGIIKASKFGAKSTKNRDSASSQFLCYGDFNLYSSNKDIYTINSITAKDCFFPVCEDIKKLSLCNYLADITYTILGMNNPDKRIMSVFLNCVYALSYKNEPCIKVKTVYELKLMSLGGYMPNLNSCFCSNNTVYGFDINRGSVVCNNCKSQNTLALTKNTYNALLYIVNCEDKKILSFNGNDKLYEALDEISENYVKTHLDKEFKSLDYYKSMLLM